MRLPLIITAIIFTISCKNTPKEITFSNENVQAAYLEYSQNVTDQNARLFSTAAIQYLSMHPDAVDKKQLLDRGLEIAEKHNLTPAKSTYLISLVRDFEGNKETPDRIYELAMMMKAGNKEAAANTLLYSFAANYKTHPKADDAKSNLTEEISDIDKYIMAIGEDIFENPDETGINKTNSQFYVDACEAYALANPNSVASPEFLYKASEIARTLRTFPKALTLYDWIITKYPNYEKSPTVLFLKGFLLESQFNNIEAAGVVYQQFLDQYPGHDLADDVGFLLENLGKSDEEIMKLIEANKGNQENQ